VVLIDVRHYQSGLYDVAQLSTNEALRAEVAQYPAPREVLPPDPSTLPPSFRDADLVVIGEQSPKKALQRSIQSRYTLGGRYNGWFSVYYRKAPPQKRDLVPSRRH
jgi:hypothetical protein